MLIVKGDKPLSKGNSVTIEIKETTEITEKTDITETNETISTEETAFAANQE